MRCYRLSMISWYTLVVVRASECGAEWDAQRGQKKKSPNGLNSESRVCPTSGSKQVLVPRLTVVLPFYHGRELFKNKRDSPTGNSVHRHFSGRRRVDGQQRLWTGLLGVFRVKLVHEALEDLVLHSTAGTLVQPVDVGPLT